MRSAESPRSGGHRGSKTYTEEKESGDYKSKKTRSALAGVAQ